MNWKCQLSECAASVFDGKDSIEPKVDLKALPAKLIGQLTLENDFLETALTKMGWLSAKR